MARATTRPESGFLQFRKRVPRDVLALVGGPKVVKASLRTRDPAEARRLFRRMEEEHEARWAQLRLGVHDLDDRQVAALAGEVYRQAVGKAGNDRDVAVQRSWSTLRAACEALDHEGPTMSDDRLLWEMDQLHGAGIREVLDRRGTRLAEGTSRRLLAAVHREMKNAAGVVSRQAGGDWSPDSNLARFPDMTAVGPPDPARQFEAVWEEWLKDAKPKAGTVRRWRPVLDRMFAAVGTTDLSKVTEGQLSAWLRGLQDDGLGNNTVAKVHLAAARGIFSFARRKKTITFDPSADLTVSSGKKFATKMRGFEQHEAEAILAASLVPPSGAASKEFAAARRWVPWICAYTGARVNEVTQARFCDFQVIAGTTVFHIREEAGTAKTGDRKVPLHEHLVEQGFMDFLEDEGGRTAAVLRAARRQDGRGPAVRGDGRAARQVGEAARHRGRRPRP